MGIEDINKNINEFPIIFKDQELYIKDTRVTSVINQIICSGQRLDTSTLSDNQLKLIRSVENSVNNAEIFRSKLNDDILNMRGVTSTSRKIRHFLNNICELSPDYLEVGCASGSTYISSHYLNNMNSSYVCDLFAESKNGENGKDTFLNNCQKYLEKDPENLFSEDCFSLDLSKISNKINLYLYDARHNVDDQEKALTYFEEVFDDDVIFIVDDWNDSRVKIGTVLGLAKIGYDIIWWNSPPAHSQITYLFKNIFAQRGQVKFSKDDPFGDEFRWHNGLMIMILSKRKKNKDGLEDNEQYIDEWLEG